MSLSVNWSLIEDYLRSLYLVSVYLIVKWQCCSRYTELSSSVRSLTLDICSGLYLSLLQFTYCGFAFYVLKSRLSVYCCNDHDPVSQAVSHANYPSIIRSLHDKSLRMSHCSLLQQNVKLLIVLTNLVTDYIISIKVINH